MAIRFSILLLLLIGATDVRAQSEQTPERLLDESETEEVQEVEEPEPELAPASNEVDVNEEYFRRSMELRDQQLQRSPDLTTGSYSRGTGLQALQGLPEESQKHLREQLREVIVENGPWTPEDENTEYPYVPSAQAEQNGTLAKREEAAWGEMVTEYHDREAAIHANAGRTQAATATGREQGQGQNSQGSQGESGQSQQGQNTQSGSELSQTGESQTGESQAEGDAARAERAAALADMLNASEAAASGAGSANAEPVEKGTEQNALQLLTSRNQLPAASTQAAQNSSPDTPSASVEISQSSGEEQTQDADSEEQVPTLDLSGDDVIAIEDLDKIRVDPQDAEEN